MRLVDTRIERTNDKVRIVGHVETDNLGPLEPYFEFARQYESFVSAKADSFVIALLVPAMAAGERLESVPAVSEQLLFNLAGIRDIFHAWHPQFSRIAIEATPRIDTGAAIASRAATFFSGGVDSFYTLLKRWRHENLPVPLTHMIFMYGIERNLEDTQNAEASERQARRVAAAIGVECIVGKTNLRTLFPLNWERFYFGSALAATAVSLSGGLGYVCIPSSFTYRHQVAHGSTPLVDERFSTETIRLLHDGGEASRARKMARILDWERSLVLENLRVCIENRGAEFNCGKCYKCVRTAVSLKAMGMWDRALTFPDKSTSHWGKVTLEDHPILTEENLALAREYGIDSDLVKLLERIVRKQGRVDGLARFVKCSPLHRLLPAFRFARRLVGGGPRMH